MDDKINDENLEIEKDKYIKMIDMVHKYMNSTRSDIMEEELLYYVAKELGIEKKVESFDPKNEVFDALGMNISEEINYKFVEDEINSNLNAKKIYLNVKKIMVNQLFSDEPKNLETIINENDKNIIINKVK